MFGIEGVKGRGVKDNIRIFELVLSKNVREGNTMDGVGLMGKRSLSNLDIHLFIHKTFIEYVLYAQH